MGGTKIKKNPPFSSGLVQDTTETARLENRINPKNKLLQTGV